MKDLGFYDGEIVDPEKPVIRLHDRAYQFGDGVYEAWVVDHGKHVLRYEHLDRFDRSVRAVGIEPTFTRKQIEGFSDRLVESSGVRDGMVYFQWSRGWQLPRSHIISDCKPLLTGFIHEIPSRSLNWFPRGQSVQFLPDERHAFCHIKTINLLGSVLAINAAVKAGFDDALLVRDIDGTKAVTEGTRSNGFAVKGGTVYTAPESRYILSGITRMAVIRFCRSLGIPVIEAFQTPEFFLAADEVFFTSASGLVPIDKIDAKTFGAHPVFNRLQQAYQDFLDAL